MQTVIVIGVGEVGQAVRSIIRDSENFGVYEFDTSWLNNAVPDKTDVIHICFPYSQNFAVHVESYVSMYHPNLVIIHSTVPVGITKQIASKINCQIAHSPVRGVHKDNAYFKEQIRTYTKFVGGANQRATLMAAKHLQECGFKVETMKDSNCTELAKLWETTYYGLMIAASQEMNRISEKLDVDYSEVQAFIRDTHDKRGDRPSMYPGFIGGHCVIPNTLLLEQCCPSDMFKFILNSNEQRRTEQNQGETVTVRPQRWHSTATDSPVANAKTSP